MQCRQMQLYCLCLPNTVFDCILIIENLFFVWYSKSFLFLRKGLFSQNGSIALLLFLTLATAVSMKNALNGVVINRNN